MTVADQLLDISCRDDSQLQRLLNDLYEYNGDLSTKVHHRSRIALFNRMMRKLIREGTITQFDNALDIGCNAGFYSNLIADFGFRDVTGVDIDPGYIAKANLTFASSTPERHLEFHVADATKLPTDKKYDLILCTEVIEHTADPEGVVRRIISMLAPGGVAVISLPNSLSLGFVTAYVGGLVRGHIGQVLRDHLQFPFYKGQSLFRRNGLRVLYSAGVNCLLNDRLLLLLYRTPLFPFVNRLNFWLSARWPFKMFSEFFFFVAK